MYSNPHNLPMGHRPPPRAFSLIELTVAIGIMIILVSLVIVASSTRDTARPRTQQVLSVLKAVADEYEVQTGSIPGHGNPGDDFVSGKMHSIEHFVHAAMQVEITEQMLRGLRENLRDDDEPGHEGHTYLEVRDGWDRKIVYRASNAGSELADDGEPRFRLSRRPFFVSLGPDGDPNRREQHLYDYDLD